MTFIFSSDVRRGGGGGGGGLTTAYIATVFPLSRSFTFYLYHMFTVYGVPHGAYHTRRAVSGQTGGTK